jgi:serpin B
MCKFTAVSWLALAAIAGGVSFAAPGGAVETAGSNNAFAFDLYHRLSSERGNLFFSPYSIHAALAMTYTGARGGTATEMARVLHLGGTREGVAEAHGDLAAELTAGTPKSYEMVVANALFGQRGYPFLEPFRATCRDGYRADLDSVDFAGATEAARRKINDWVSTRTRARIRELFAPGGLDASTRLVLANAVYFKGKWEEPFADAATREAPFDPGTGRKVAARFMNQRHRFGYAETPELQLLEMPYEGDELSMVVLLPRNVGGLAALEATLTGSKMADLLASAASREVSVSFPKFELTSAFDLDENLRAMGMSAAFSRQAADFSGMTDAGKLFIGVVVHKAYVDVDEEGTEAAAATGVGMVLTSMPAHPTSFVADHPFLFLIRHRASGAILFLGRVVDPTAKAG